MRKKTIIWLASICTVFLALGMSHRFFICFGMKSYLGVDHFSYETGGWADGKLILRDVHVERRSGKEKLPFSLEVDDLKVALHLELFPFHFSSHVFVERPSIVLKEGERLPSKGGKGVYQTLDHLFFKTSLTVTDASIHIGDEVAYLTFECPEEERQGRLTIAKDRAAPSLELMLNKEDEALQFTLDFKELDASWAFEMCRFFSPYLREGARLGRGKINGTVACSLLPSLEVGYTKYALDFKDFAFASERHGLQGSFKHLRWKEHFTSSEEMGKLRSYPFFKHLWPYFIGDGEVSGLHVEWKVPQNGAVWAAADVNGGLHFNLQNAPLIECHGLFHRGDKEVPFQLAGEGRIEEETSWKVAFAAHFFEEEEITASFALSSLGEGKFFIESEGKRLTPDQLSFFQSLAGASFPICQEVAIEEGTFDIKAEGSIDHRAITRFEILHFSGEEVAIHLPWKEATWKGKKISGKGEFDLSSADFFDGTCWEVEALEGAFSVDGKEIEGVDFSIAMHDQYLKPSKLSCRYQETQAAFAFEGLYTHLNIHADLLFDPELALGLEMKLKSIDHRLGVEGTLGILQDRDEKETIEFGWSWGWQELLSGKFLTALDEGWFRGKTISAATLNLPLALWEWSFRAEGHLNIDGTFDGAGVEFSIDPTFLKYRSPAIDIEPRKKEGERASDCTFLCDFKTGLWRGNIPLEGAYVREHSFGIEFNSFTSEVTLEGAEFLFHNVDALADGLRFQAEIAVDFAPVDRNRLTINTYAIDGDMKDVLRFLNHFETFQGLELPLTGTVSSGPGEMHLSAYVGGVEELLEWKIAFHFKEGSYPLSETLKFENLSGNLFYSADKELFKVQEVAGELTLTGAEAPKSYALNVPLFELDAKEGVLTYDCRLEGTTYEICRLAGQGTKEEGEFHFHLDPEHTRFFGAQVDFKTLAFKEGALACADFSTTLSALDLVHHLDFLNGAGFLPMKRETLDEMRGSQVAGEMQFTFFCNQEEEKWSFGAESSHLKMGEIDLDHLLIRGEKWGDHFTLERFEAGALKIQTEMVRKCGQWAIPNLEILWRENFFKSGAATFDEEEKRLCIPLEGLRVNLEEVAFLPPLRGLATPYLKGTFFVNGEMVLDFSQGLRQWTLDSHLKLLAEGFGKGGLRIESSDLLHLSYHPSSGFSFDRGDFNFIHPRSNQLWAKCHFNRLDFKKGGTKGEGFQVVIPPEMVHFLGQTRAVPYLGYEEERVLAFGHSFEWENQIEAFFDFELGESPSVEGHLKEGYYWVGDKAWYLSDCFFSCKEGNAQLKINTLYEDIPFDLGVDLSFYPHLISRVVIQETCNDQRSHSPLVIQTDWNEKEGFFIQSIDGGVCGLDFAFHHNSRESFLGKMTLTGQLKVNAPQLAQVMPKSVQEIVDKFGIGKGYVLSGDMVLSTKAFEESYFSGYLKGKNFQLLGSQMKTLMSETSIHLDHIEFDNFTVSDASGMFAIESVRLLKGNEGEWKLVIPEAVVTDFRPSLLQKIGKYPTRIKPLTIRKLRATNIQGTLGDLSTFVGKGSLSFTNTFKRDYHILDIPFEILGRLGLDMGLLVPVRGKLDYVIIDGKIYFTELKKSYSEGKRSQFFLSPMEHSYVDFEGNIHVNIKMKQYVLLKVTEPFTLSIGGTFEKPKYRLH